MDLKQAQNLLGLTGGENHHDIAVAYQNKLALLDEKTAAAPTDALREKYQEMEQTLAEAQKLMLDNAPQKQSKSSPLSSTKMADLPGAGESGELDSALEIGTVLADRYEIKAFIAEGGMGAVYRAFDKNRNEDIAIKVMLPGLMQNATARERFLDEARLSSQLSHPNIVNVYDVQQSNALCFLTMELLQGQDLRELMDNRKIVRQNFSVEEVIEILEPICAGLDHAHEITVHRDIKPENIFLTEEGKYKLMDFGIARIMSTSQRTQTGAASGTAYYMAPEQLKGAKNIDGRADQYALAVLAYELLSGEVPAGAIEPLHELVKGINKKISMSVQKALSPKPENRFDNLTEFVQAIKGNGNRAAIPALPIKNLGIAALVLVSVLGIGGLVGSGGLEGLWESIKPVDKELIARQKAAAEKALADKKGEVAKLQGEINTYKKRLDNGQRNLSSEVRDAQRNNTNDLKYLQHWQRLTDDYLFAGNEITELEGELSKGESLLRADSVEQANTTLTQVRDGYQLLWEQFSAAEDLLKVEEQSLTAKQDWAKRKQAYGLSETGTGRAANESESNATGSQRIGDFVAAAQHWQSAKSQWQEAYQAADSQVAGIDRNRAEVKRKAQAQAKEAAAAAKALIARAVGVMVNIPSGSFQMGCVSGLSCSGDEKPVHNVSIKAFKMGQSEVTFAQWDACVSAGGCSHKPDDKGWGRGTRPVIAVSYNDITQQFIPWLNKVTGQTFRLPSEAEWEYAARAGSRSKYPWGNAASHNQANYGTDSCCAGFTSGKDQWINTAPVKSFSANAFGLYDMHGNVWEWTQDCYNASYNGAPRDGLAWNQGDCSKRMLRGGSWYINPNNLRSANRYWSTTSSTRYNNNGFRLVQDPR